MSQILQQQRQIIQEQEQRRRQELDKLRDGAAPKKEEERKDGGQQGPAKNCVPVRKINFDGAELLGEEERQALRQPFVNKCMSIVDIMAVVRAVTNWYVDQGYVTARAWPPEQDLAKGTLTIKVIEGRTQEVGIYENGKPRRGVDTAFPDLAGTRLYIRDIEQGLDQINRMPTRDATIRIEAGDKEGYSKIRVDTRASVLPYVTSTVDNYGLKSTGELQSTTSVYADDIFGLYDSWVLTYRNSEVFYEGEEQQKGAKEITLGMSVPYGYWTLLLSGSYFDYKSTMKTQTQTVDTDGTSKYYTAELERVLHRGRDSKTRLTGFLNYKDTENSIAGYKMGVHSRQLNVVGTRLSHMHRLLGGRLDTSLSGHFGVPMFGSLTDEQPSAFKAEFKKVSGDIGFYRPFAIDKLNFAWNTRASGQWTNDKLYSSEQISLGSMYTVRGFKNQSLSADTGGYVRNELIWAVPQMLPDSVKPVFGNLSVFAGYDHGWVKPDKTEAFQHGQVAGVSTGVRLSGGYLTAEAAYEKPLEAPQFIHMEEQLRLQAGVAVKW